VIPAPKSEEEAARERQEREEKAELDRKLVKFNGIPSPRTAFLNRFISPSLM